MKKKGLIVVAIIAILAIVGVSTSKKTESNKETNNVSTDAKNDDTSNTSNDTPKDDASNASNDTQNDEASTDNQEKEEPKYLDINSTGNLKDWEITVTEMQIQDEVKYSYGAFKPDEGNKYMSVSVKVTNKGKSSDSFLPTVQFGDTVNAKVLYGDGYEYSATHLLGYDKEMHDSSINPLASKEGEITFSIPEAIASSEDELLIEFTSGHDNLVYKLR